MGQKMIPKPKSRNFSQHVRLKKLLKQHKAVLKFSVIYVCVVSFIFILSFTGYMDTPLLLPVNIIVAKSSALVLKLLGENASVNMITLFSDRYSVDIDHSCNAIHVTAIYLVAVLAAPRKMSVKLAGAIIGIILIFLINLTRVVGLFYIGVHESEYVRLAHVYAFPVIIIFFTVFIWLLWMRKSQSASTA